MQLITCIIHVFTQKFEFHCKLLILPQNLWNCPSKNADFAIRKENCSINTWEPQERQTGQARKKCWQDIYSAYSRYSPDHEGTDLWWVWSQTAQPLKISRAITISAHPYLKCLGQVTTTPLDGGLVVIPQTIWTHQNILLSASGREVPNLQALLGFHVTRDLWAIQISIFEPEVLYHRKHQKTIFSAISREIQPLQWLPNQWPAR